MSPQFASHIKAAYDGEAEVEEDDIGPAGESRRNRSPPVERAAYLVSHPFNGPLQHLDQIVVVFDYEDLQPPARRTQRRLALLGWSGFGGGTSGSRTTNSAPDPSPRECASIEPACNCTRRFAIANPTPSAFFVKRLVK